jgi:hypothetical protein
MVAWEDIVKIEILENIANKVIIKGSKHSFFFFFISKRKIDYKGNIWGCPTKEPTLGAEFKWDRYFVNEIELN